MQLINRTPFPGSVFVDTDRHGTETLVLVMKATYHIGDAEILQPAPVQEPLMFTDLYAGPPGASSLLYESDANWGRSATDVALLGYAYPAQTGDRKTDIALRVGDLVKTARVFGERTWSSTLGIAQMSVPAPFERIPLIYENAFGGIDDSPEQVQDAESEARNPVGQGLRARNSRKPVDAMRLPNIEDPQNLLGRPGDRTAPVGFTFVAKAWAPRGTFAGTYDAAWQATRMPLLPKDFDPRFYCAASEGMSMPFVQGGEPVDLLNLTPSKRARFMLPRFDLQASFLIDAAPSPIAMRLDVIVIDAVKSKLVMVWHGNHPIPGAVDDVQWVLVEGGPA